ncbi:hypothetical protein [Nocardioides terrae]|uniref:hypothetical protein n=1 Tax=Nocardioides terrae TaxID=574651 RepID=UPI003CCBF60A
MSAIDYGLVCLEIEATDSGLRSLVSVQGSLAMSRSGGRRSDPRLRRLPGGPCGLAAPLACSTKRATESCGARLAPPAPASRRPGRTPSSDVSSASRSVPSS